jgi:hypothetical protein
MIKMYPTIFEDISRVGPNSQWWSQDFYGIWAKYLSSF